jgi:uncharacterized protein YggE
MKKRLLLSFLLSALWLHADGLPNQPYLYAIGFAKRSVPADQLRIRFSLEAREKEPIRATAIVEERAKKVLALLATLSITEQDISAASVSTRLKYDEEKGKEFLGYEVEREFTVLLRDVARYGELAKALLDVPVDGLSLEKIGYSKAESLAKELEEEARKDARTSADRIAASFGMEVVGVYAISPVSFSELDRQWPYDFEVRGYAAGGRSGPSQFLSFVIPPFTVTREAHVIFLIRQENQPNKPPLRMPVSGTPAADAPVAPPPGIAGR